MGKLIENFNKQYPLFAAIEIKGDCIIDEQEAEDATHCFRELTILGFEGWQFPHELPKKATSFYQKAQETLMKEENSHKVVRMDCDSILCVEKDDRVIFYLCELKSSYIQENIIKAKDQIVGSYIKLHGMLSLLQDYDKNKIEIYGIIVSYEADVERLSGLKDMENKGARFCVSLYSRMSYDMPRKHCEKYWYPLVFQDIKIKYVKIPRTQKQYTIDFSSIR